MTMEMHIASSQQLLTPLLTLTFSISYRSNPTFEQTGLHSNLLNTTMMTTKIQVFHQKNREEKQAFTASLRLPGVLTRSQSYIRKETFIATYYSTCIELPIFSKKKASLLLSSYLHIYTYSYAHWQHSFQMHSRSILFHS